MKIKTVIILLVVMMLSGQVVAKDISAIVYLLFASNSQGTQIDKFGGCQIFPANNFWNTPIIDYPLHPKSADYINNIGSSTTLHPDFGDGYRENGELITAYGIAYVVVSANPEIYQSNPHIYQKSVIPISFQWWDESDCQSYGTAAQKLCQNNTTGAYPTPARRIAQVNDNVEALSQIIESGSDSHLIAIDADNCQLYEVQSYNWAVTGNTITNVTGASGAIWDLSKNEQRIDNYTSADAAGLAIFPGLVKFDEVFKKYDPVNGHEYGEIHHAIRVTLQNPQKAYVHPATHSDGNQGGGCAFSANSNCLPMGQKLRLKMTINQINNSNYTQANKIILRALRTYGLVIADTGGDLFISGDHDPRWVNDDVDINALKHLSAADFEAVIRPEGERVYDYSWSSGESVMFYPD